jgi:CHAD domain-containing protein
VNPVLRLDRPHLHRPTAETARLLALSALKEAGEAHARIGPGSDGEALHDFRVGLRRLRSVLRAYRPHVSDTVKKKLRVRLKDLAASTGEGRDAEVGVTWLSSFSGRVREKEQPGHRWLLKRLEAKKEDAYERVAAATARDFDKLRASLENRLAYYHVAVQEEPPPPFRVASARLIHEHVDELRERIDQWASAGTEETAHTARIAAKRLRYLLEPFAAALPAAARAVEGWKAFQDGLGDLHDLHVLRSEVSAAEATLDDSGLEAGVARVLALIALQEKKLSKHVETRWLEGRAEGLLARSRTLADSMLRGSWRRTASRRKASSHPA